MPKRLDGLQVITDTAPNSIERRLGGLALDVQQGIRDHDRSIIERNSAIREAYASGMTYQAIGDCVGLTKERIRQICDERGRA